MYQFPAVRWQKNSSIRQAHCIAFQAEASACVSGLANPPADRACVLFCTWAVHFVFLSLCSKLSDVTVPLLLAVTADAMASAGINCCSTVCQHKCI